MITIELSELIGLDGGEYFLNRTPIRVQKRMTFLFVYLSDWKKGLEYRCFPVWLYGENGEVIGNVSIHR